MSDDWRWIKLSHAYPRIGSGTTPPDERGNYTDDDSGTNWVTTSELRESQISETKKQVSNEALKRYPTLRVYRPGSVLFAMYGATIGRLGVLDKPACCNQACCVFECSKAVSNRYLVYWLQYRRADLVALSVGGGQPNLSQQDLRNERVYCPDLATQRQIAEFLDRETARIDLLIENKQRLVDIVAPRFEALIHEARQVGDWRRFGFCAQTTPRPIPHNQDATYAPLGLYNRGRGFFRKPETAYDDLGDSSFFFVEEGDLVFSGQFAWEGAVGLVSKREGACVVSHRYPVYTGAKDVLSEYLFAYFRSHHGQFLMDNCSRGAAGRNRPLNTRILEKEKIPVPSVGLQQQVADIIKFERRLKEKTAPSINRLKEYRSALITAAVTGQIDVSSYAKSGAPDRDLNVIQEEMGA